MHDDHRWMLCYRCRRCHSYLGDAMFQDPVCSSAVDCNHTMTTSDRSNITVSADGSSSFQLSDVGDMRLPLHTIIVDVSSLRSITTVHTSIEQVSYDFSRALCNHVF